MTKISARVIPDLQKLYPRLFTVTAAALAITALGQMPLFQRYYIADLPGLSWTGNYLVMYNLHVISALVMAFLLPLGVSLNYFRERGDTGKGTFTTLSLIVFGVFFAGVLLKIYSVTFASLFSREGAFIISIVHMGLTFLFITGSVFLLFFEKLVMPAAARIKNIRSGGAR